VRRLASAAVSSPLSFDGAGDDFLPPFSLLRHDRRSTAIFSRPFFFCSSSSVPTISWRALLPYSRSVHGGPSLASADFFVQPSFEAPLSGVLPSFFTTTLISCCRSSPSWIARFSLLTPLRGATTFINYFIPIVAIASFNHPLCSPMLLVLRPPFSFFLLGYL